MSVQVQFRRGNTSQHSTFTGVAGEITVDTDKNVVVVHNGVTAGGTPLATEEFAIDIYNYANTIAISANVAQVTSLIISSYDNSNAAFNKANASNVLAYNTGIGANSYTNSVGASGNTYTNTSTDAANNYAGSMANSANAYAVTVGASGNDYINTSTTAANNYSGSMANSVNAYVNVSTGSANDYANVIGLSGNTYTNTSTDAANNYAGYMANSANAYAASLTPDLSPPFNVANASFDKANAANVLAYNTGIGANAYATDVGTAGNAYAVTVGISGNNYANSTFVKLTAGSQTITGDFSITGNLFIGGNTTAVSANNLIVNDPLIYLANNNTTDTLDIGFVGSYYNVASAHVHTGLYRDHASKKYYLFQGYDGNPDVVNEITPYSNNMVNATLVADFNTSNLTLGDANAIVWIKSAYDNANAAYGNANSVATSANNYAGAMANAANSVAATKVASVTGTAGQIFSSGGTTPTLNLISSGVTATTYGGATQVPSFVVDTYGRITSAANVAVQGMDYAYVNTVWGVANAKVDTITSNSTTRVWANSVTVGSIETVYLDLATSGVTATTYGGSTQIPVITVDAYGRLTSAANAAVQGMDYAYANTIWGVANGKVETVSSNSTARIWANTVTVGSTETVYVDLATSGVTATTYGGTSTIPTIVVDAFGRITSATNNAVTIVSSVTGTAGQIFSSGGTTPTVNLISTGVTATTYGGATQIPVIVVDAFGRLTSASNVAVSGMDYPYVNTSTAAANAYTNTSTTAANNYAGVMANSANGNASTLYAPKASPTFTGTVTINANVSNQTLTDGATISWDVSTGAVATVTLGGNRTVAAPTNLKIGTYILHVIQDATGSRTLTWNAVFKWPAATAPTLTTTANARDVFSFICDGTNLYGTYVPDVR